MDQYCGVDRISVRGWFLVECSLLLVWVGYNAEDPEFIGWWHGIALTHCVRSTKLLYGGPPGAVCYIRQMNSRNGSALLQWQHHEHCSGCHYYYRNLVLSGHPLYAGSVCWLWWRPTVSSGVVRQPCSSRCYVPSWLRPMETEEPCSSSNHCLCAGCAGWLWWWPRVGSGVVCQPCSGQCCLPLQRAALQQQIHQDLLAQPWPKEHFDWCQHCRWSAVHPAGCPRCIRCIYHLFIVPCFGWQDQAISLDGDWENLTCWGVSESRASRPWQRGYSG